MADACLLACGRHAPAFLPVYGGARSTRPMDPAFRVAPVPPDRGAVVCQRDLAVREPWNRLLRPPPPGASWFACRLRHRGDGTSGLPRLRRHPRRQLIGPGVADLRDVQGL